MTIVNIVLRYNCSHNDSNNHNHKIIIIMIILVLRGAARYQGKGAKPTWESTCKDSLGLYRF